jgi:hypothetical protein
MEKPRFGDVAKDENGGLWMATDIVDSGSVLNLLPLSGAHRKHPHAAFRAEDGYRMMMPPVGLPSNALVTFGWGNVSDLVVGLDSGSIIVSDTSIGEGVAEEQEIYAKASRLDALREFMVWRHERALSVGDFDKVRTHATTLFFIETGKRGFEHGDECADYGARIHEEAHQRILDRRSRDLQHRHRSVTAPHVSPDLKPEIFDTGKARDYPDTVTGEG